jgi:hypothetical protein
MWIDHDQDRGLRLPWKSSSDGAERLDATR